MRSMPGRTQKKRRAVIILHPDFEQDGKAGILEAKQFAEELIKSQRDLVKMAAESQPSAVVDRIREHTARIQVIVRNIPEEVI